MSLTIKLCKRGHELTENNTYIQSSGTISCRECKRGHNRKYINSDKGLETQRRYSKTDTGRKQSRLKHKGYRINGKYDLQIINRQFIHNSKRRGDLIMKNVCVDCNKHGFTEIHHEVYHDPPLLIDIRELCKKCHIIADKLIL